MAVNLNLNATIRERGLDDLVLLDEINEENVCRTLKSRFLDASGIYTYSGPVLVSLNPYKLLVDGKGKSIYSEEVMDQYRGRVHYEMPPHVFAIAEAAYSSMLRYRKASGIIISGESGAGKTEAARQVLAYVARVSGAYLAASTAQKHHHHHGKGGKAAVSLPPPKLDKAAEIALKVKDRLITSTVVTEAFGNSMTTRNDNSSRFGKLMAVTFRPSGIASGGQVQIYLLEKSRVVKQRETERNFHVFYQFLAGASPDIRAKLKLGNMQPEAFKLLSEEYRKIPGVNDASQWKALVACLNIMGVPPDKQQQLWTILACVLHLGQLEFTSAEDDEGGAMDEDDVAALMEDASGATAATTGASGGGGAGGAGGPTDAAAGTGAKGSLNAHAASIRREGSSAAALAALSSLLLVKEEEIESALVHRTLVISGSETQALNNTSQAKVARDSLCKTLYEKLFLLAVEYINASIASNAADATKEASSEVAAAAAAGGAAPEADTAAAAEAEAEAEDASGGGSGDGGKTARERYNAAIGKDKDDISSAKKSPGTASPAPVPAPAVDTSASDDPSSLLNLSVLDIYGFESLSTNGFEQLCINYCNERLQTLFINATLKAEQEEYEQEGIQWTPIAYTPNDPVLTLLEGKAGIFPLLDDACAMADASSNKIMTLFNKHWAAPGKSEHYSAPKINDGTFTISHYAGPVTYHANMGGANRDTLTLDVTRLMIKSTGGTAALAASNAKTAKQAKALLAQAAADAKKNTTVGDGGGLWALAGAFEDKRPPVERSKRPPTAGFQFRQSMSQLIAVLEACQPFYIRTVKPNDQKKAMTVDDERLRHQVTYLGLVEATRVKRAGFASRSTYQEFLGRYRMLSKATWPPKPEHQNNDEQGARDLLAGLHVWSKPKTAGALGVGLGAGGNRLNAAAPKAKAAASKGAAGTAAGGAKAGGPVVSTAAKPDILGIRRGAAGAANGGTGGDAASAASAAAASAPIEAWSGSQCPGDVNVAGSRMLKEGVDFQWGATKIFLKEPSTLFNLEYMRVLALGRVVSKVAALWRAHTGVRNYKRIKKAWLKQQANVRAHLQRKRFLKMKASAVKCQAIVRGFLARISPSAMAMREGLGMISFYGKPRRRMSLHWAPPVKGDWLGLFMQQSEQTFGGSRTTSTCIPAPQAASLFRALSKLRPPQTPESVAFADTVLKIKQDYSILRRVLVVTDAYVLNFGDPWQKGRVNRKIPIQDIRGISMSPYRDGYLVLHVADSYDFVCMAETKVNLVRAIAAKYKALTGADLPVTVAPEITYRAKKGDPPERLRRLNIRQVPDLSFFEKRKLEPWEQKVLPTLASQKGGIGGRATLSLGDGGVIYAYAEGALDGAGGAGSASGSGDGGGAGTGTGTESVVVKSYMEAEKHRPLHQVGGDKASLLVSVPVPPKVKLASILTDGEKEKLKKMGVRAVL